MLFSTFSNLHNVFCIYFENFLHLFRAAIFDHAADTKRLILKHPVASLKAGQTLQTADNIYIEEGKFSGTEITGNIFRQSRRYGLMLRTNNTLVEGNTFENLGGAGIFLQNDPYDEGIGVKNLSITDNSFDNVGYMSGSKNAPGGAAVSINGRKSGGKADGYIHKNIIFSGNYFTGLNRAAVYADSVDGISFEDTNTIFENRNISANDASTIRLEKSRDILLQGLHITDYRQNLSSALFIKNDCGEVSVSDNTFILNGADEIILEE